MKHYLLFLPAVLFSALVSGQLVSEAWASRYNGPASKFDGTRDMCVDSYGNVYVTGPSEGKKGNSDYVTIKYSHSAEPVWIARYNGTGNSTDWPSAITVDAGGNVYVTGRSIGMGTAEDYATVKYDASGNQLWVTRYNGSANMVDIARDIAVDAGGDVFVTGFTNGNTTVSGTIITTIKYNASGQQVGIDHYNDILPGGPVNDREEGNTIITDGAGNVYVGGASLSALLIKYQSDVNSFTRAWAQNFAGAGNGRKIAVNTAGEVYMGCWGSGFVTLKSDANGILLWQSVYQGPGGSDGIWDLGLDASGNVFVTGYSAGADGSNDYATVKYNSSGLEQWVRRYSTSNAGRDHARALAIDAQGSCYVTGFSELISGRSVNTNYATVKYNADGLQQWVKLYDGPDKSADEGFSIVVDVNGNCYVSGQSGSKLGYIDMVTVKYTQAGSRDPIQVMQAPQLKGDWMLQAYPNPAKGSACIRYNLAEAGKLRLRILDVTGREVMPLLEKMQDRGVYQLILNIQLLPAGSYIIQMQTAKVHLNQRLVVMD